MMKLDVTMIIPNLGVSGAKTYLASDQGLLAIGLDCDLILISFIGKGLL